MEREDVINQEQKNREYDPRDVGDLALEFSLGDYVNAFESMGEYLGVDINVINTHGFDEVLGSVESICSEGSSVVTFDTDGVLVVNPFNYAWPVRKMINRDLVESDLHTRIDTALELVEGEYRKPDPHGYYYDGDRPENIALFITNRTDPNISNFNTLMSDVLGTDRIINTFESVGIKPYKDGGRLYTGVNRQVPFSEKNIGDIVRSIKTSKETGEWDSLRRMQIEGPSLLRELELISRYFGNSHLREFVDRGVMPNLRGRDNFVFVFDTGRVSTFIHDILMAEMAFMFYTICITRGHSFNNYKYVENSNKYGISHKENVDYWEGKKIWIVMDGRYFYRNLSPNMLRFVIEKFKSLSK